MESILKEASGIVDNRSEEKDRKYGPFIEGMKRAALIASGSTGKKWETRDMFIALVALKLSRESYNHKRDNLLDAVAYLSGLNDFEEEVDCEFGFDNWGGKKQIDKNSIKPVSFSSGRKESYPIIYFKELLTNHFIKKPKNTPGDIFRARLQNIKKTYGINIFCDRSRGVSGDYVCCGSQMSDVDFIVSLWNNGKPSVEIVKAIKKMRNNS